MLKFKNPLKFFKINNILSFYKKNYLIDLPSLKENTKDGEPKQQISWFYSFYSGTYTPINVLRTNRC